MRRMYSKAQLSAIIAEKLNDYDATQIWHSVQIYSLDAQEYTLAFVFPASDSNVIDNMQDLVKVFQGKRIPVTGFHVTQMTEAGTIDQAFVLMDVGNTLADTYIIDAKSSRRKFTDVFGTQNVKVIDNVYEI